MSSGVSAVAPVATTGHAVARSLVRWIPCLLALALLSACAVPREPVQRADRAMVPGSVVGPESASWDTPASLLGGHSPVYPIGQFMTGGTGYAEVAFTVGTDGATKDIEVVEADQPAFGNHLAIAVRSWRFEPARKNGEPVASRLAYGVCFRIERNFDVPRPPRGSKRCDE